MNASREALAEALKVAQESAWPKCADCGKSIILGSHVCLAPEPCKCHHSTAYISPTHGGHCCFVPADQTCHADEVAEWEARAGRTPQDARS